MGKIMEAFTKYPTSIAEFYKISQNNSLRVNSTQLIKIQPIIKYMTVS
jgi:hypothetical protein